MAHRDPTPLSALLPALLGRLAQEGSAAPAALGALWPRVQGTVIGAQSKPVELVDERLTKNRAGAH